MHIATLTNAPANPSVIGKALLQRKCACGQPTVAGGECGACRDEKNKLRRSGVETATTGVAPPSVHEVLRTPGEPLGQRVRADMELRFARNLGRVRVHSDHRAANSAREVGAGAYTVGSQIVFAAGQFQPTSGVGRKLPAHELTHVVQQDGTSPRSDITIGSIDDPAELQAEQSADRIVSGVGSDSGPIQSGMGGSTLQREPSPDDGPAPGAIVLDDPAYDGDVPVNASAGGGASDSLSSDSLDVGPSDQILLANAKQGPDGGVGSGSGSDTDTKTPPPTIPPAKSPKKPRWTIDSIDVNLSSQTLVLNKSDGTTESHSISSGRGRPDTKGDPCKDQTEENCTPVGSFTVGTIGDGSTTNNHGDKMSWYVEFVEK